MAGKNYFYVDRMTKKQAMSNTTFQVETFFTAFENPKNGRELFVSINEIVEASPELAKALIAKAMDEFESNKPA